MSNFLFVPYVLNLLSQGTFFRRIFFYFFRAAAVLCAVIGLVASAGLLKTVLNLPAVGVIGGFVFIALLVVAFYVAAHIYWIRAADIRDLPDAKFTVIPIYAIMIRTVGEVLAAFLAVISCGGCILFLFAPMQAGGMLSQFMPMGPLAGLVGRGSNTFVAAIVVLVGGLIYAIVILALFYLVSEAIMAVADIAISSGKTALNTALLAGTGGIGTLPVAPVMSAMPTHPAATPVLTEKVCKACGSTNPAMAVFCENCGRPLASRAA